jgi:hypothetical protein
MLARAFLFFPRGWGVVESTPFVVSSLIADFEPEHQGPGGAAHSVNI